MRENSQRNSDIVEHTVMQTRIKVGRASEQKNTHKFSNSSDYLFVGFCQINSISFLFFFLLPKQNSPRTIISAASKKENP